MKSMHLMKCGQRIKTKYANMVSGENACSTLWEFWDPNEGTRNHAWAGGPLIIMSKYFAGIQPLEPGYNTIFIQPHFINLSKISCDVETIKGHISLEGRKNNNLINLKINIPSKAKIAVEKVSNTPVIQINGKTVFDKLNISNNEAEYDSEDEKYIYFYIEAGKYEIESK